MTRWGRYMTRWGWQGGIVIPSGAQRSRGISQGAPRLEERPPRDVSAPLNMTRWGRYMTRWGRYMTRVGALHDKGGLYMTRKPPPLPEGASVCRCATLTPWGEVPASAGTTGGRLTGRGCLGGCSRPSSPCRSPPCAGCRPRPCLPAGASSSGSAGSRSCRRRARRSGS